MRLKKFISNFDVIPTMGDNVEIFCDNEGAIALTKKPGSPKQTRHIRRNTNTLEISWNKETS